MYFCPLLRESKRHHDSAESSPSKAEQVGRLDSHPLLTPSLSSCAEASSQHVHSEQQESGGTVTIVCARRQSPQLSSALHDIQSCPLYSIKNYPEVIFRASKPHSRPTKSVLASLGRPQMNQRHDGRIAVKQVLVLDLVTLLQDKVPGDYAVTPNFSVSKEAK